MLEYSLDQSRLRMLSAMRGLLAARVVTISLAFIACSRGAPKTAGDRSMPVADAGNTRYFELSENHSDTPNCINLVVGSAREQAVLCDEFGGGYWRVTRQVVRVVRAGKSVPVLDLLTKIEGIDSGNKELELRLRIAADGMSATTLNGEPSKISDQPGPFEDCDTASAWKDDGTQQTFGEPTYGELRRRLCSGRGAYRWIDGRFKHIRR